MPSVSFDPGKEIVSVLKSVKDPLPGHFFLGIHIYADNSQTNHSHGFIFALELLQDIIYRFDIDSLKKILKSLAVPVFSENR